MKKKERSKEAVPDDLITQTEAADLRGVDLGAVNQWVRRGRVRSFEKYGRRLVSRSEVLSYDPGAHKGGRPSTKKGGDK
jgi:hypothetical protein